MVVASLYVVSRYSRVVCVLASCDYWGKLEDLRERRLSTVEAGAGRNRRIPLNII